VISSYTALYLSISLYICYILIEWITTVTKDFNFLFFCFLFLVPSIDIAPRLGKQDFEVSNQNKSLLYKSSIDYILNVGHVPEMLIYFYHYFWPYYIIIYTILHYISTYVLKLHSNSLICSVYLYCFFYDQSVSVIIYIHIYIYIYIHIFYFEY